MAKVDLSAILSKQVGSAPEPKAIPAGTYEGSIAAEPGQREFTAKDGTKWIIIGFKLNLLEAMDDVPADELEASGGLRRSDGSARTAVHEVWIRPDQDESFYGLDVLLKSFGYGLDSGKSYVEVFEELVDKECVISVEHESYTDRAGNDRTKAIVKRVYGKDAA